MDVCKEVANSGAAVVMVIHQPTSKAFAMMDHLIFLKGGRTMYQGRADKLIDYVGERGFPVPESFNPAEWMVELSLDNEDETLENAGFFDRATFDLDQQQESGFPTNGGKFRRLSILDGLSSNERTSLGTEYMFLMKRELKGLIRNKAVTSARVGVVLFASLAHSVAFWNVGEDSLESEGSFLSHLNAVYFLTIAIMFIIILVLIDVEETQPLFLREFTSSYYRLVSYVMSTVTFEMILATILTSVRLAACIVC